MDSFDKKLWNVPGRETRKYRVLTMERRWKDITDSQLGKKHSKSSIRTGDKQATGYTEPGLQNEAETHASKHTHVCRNIKLRMCVCVRICLSYSRKSMAMSP